MLVSSNLPGMKMAPLQSAFHLFCRMYFNLGCLMVSRD